MYFSNTSSLGFLGQKKKAIMVAEIIKGIVFLT